MATSADTVKDIRAKYHADKASWQEIRQDGDRNMLVVAGDVWEAMAPEAKRAREAEDSKRP